MAAVEAIEQPPVNGETPVQRIDLKAVRIVKRRSQPHSGSRHHGTARDSRFAVAVAK